MISTKKKHGDDLRFEEDDGVAPVLSGLVGTVGGRLIRPCVALVPSPGAGERGRPAPQVGSGGLVRANVCQRGDC